MKPRQRVWCFVSIAAFLGLLLITRFAHAGTVTGATGGSSISADTAATGGSGAWTSLTGPTYQETVNGDLNLGTVILTVPTGFQFNTGVTVSVVLLTGDSNAGKNMNNTAVGGNVATTSNGTLTVTASTITFTITSKSQGNTLNSIRWTGIQVRPTNGTPLASGNITPSGVSAIATAANTTNFGTLTEVAGAMQRLLVVLPGQSFTSGTGVTGSATAQTAGSSFNIAQLVAADQFNNLVSSYSGSKTISYTGPGTGCGLSPSYTTTVNFTSGVSTTTLATTLRKAETTTITASDGTISGPASSSLIVNPGTVSKLVVTLPGETFTACVGNSGTPTNQTVGVSFNIASIIATDANFNVVTSYSGAKTLSYSGPTGSPSYTTAVSFTSGQATTTLATTLNVAETKTITVSDGTTTGPASSSLTVVSGVTVNSFNGFETSTAANATTGVIKTKIAGTSFGLDIVALTSTPSVSTGFTGAVKVELIDSSGGGSCGTWPVIQTLANQTFIAGDNGRHTIASITEPNAWRNVRLRISYPTASPTIVNCSSDNFAIRPNTLAALSITDLDWQTAGTMRALTNTAVSGGVVHKAATAFSMQATARNSSAVTTTNYSGTPVAVLTQCGTAACPAVANLGTLSLGTWSASAGVITTSTANYSEVGAFTLTLQDQTFSNVDSADSTTAERYINSSAVDVGRFVPDRYDFTSPNTPQLQTFGSSCATRSFTYIGQPFGYVTTPQVTVNARNASGAVTVNYTGSLFTLTTGAVTQTYSPISPASPALDVSLIGAPVITSNNNGTASLSANSADKLSYIRSNTTPQAAFTANITLSWSISDSSENGTSGNGIIVSSASQLFNGGGSGIAFDSGNTFRFGRLRLSNTYGSELLDLPAQLTPQYWNGTGFVNAGSADSCTTIAASDIAATFPAATANHLAACNTTISLVSGLPANLKLTKPGVGRDGWVNLRVNLGASASGNTCVGAAPTAATTANKAYLRGNWGTATFDQDPTALVRFGSYRSGDGMIYLRENY